MSKYDNRIKINSEFPRKVGVVMQALGRSEDIIDSQYEIPRITSESYGKTMGVEDDLQDCAETFTKRVIERLEELRQETEEHLDYFNKELTLTE